MRKKCNCSISLIQFEKNHYSCCGLEEYIYSQLLLFSHKHEFSIQFCNIWFGYLTWNKLGMPLLLIMQLLLKFAKNKKDIKRIRVKTRIVFLTMVFNIYVDGGCQICRPNNYDKITSLWNASTSFNWINKHAFKNYNKARIRPSHLLDRKLPFALSIW